MNGHQFGSSDSADSAGQPWSGRSFEQNAHADDDGSAPVELMDAVAAFRAGENGLEAVVDAVRGARLLVPLLAAAGETGVTAQGLTVDKTQELAVVTVATPDHRTALPVFSSVEAMQSWNPKARPVPVDGVRVALAAAGEGTPVVLLDPGASALALRRPAVWAIAKGEPWQPPERDAQLLALFQQSVSDEPAVRRIRAESGDPAASLHGPELVIELMLDPGLDQPSLNGIVERLSDRWAASEYFAAHVDSLGLKLVPAGPPRA